MECLGDIGGIGIEAQCVQAVCYLPLEPRGLPLDVAAQSAWDLNSVRQARVPP